MKRRPRQPKTGLVVGLVGALVFWSLLVVRGGAVAWIATVAFLAVFVYRFVVWLLAPYSDRAWQLASVRVDQLDKWQRRADALGRIPVFGALWRFCQKLSQPMVDAQVEELRRIADEDHDI